jgi:cell division protein FtsZ
MIFANKNNNKSIIRVIGVGGGGSNAVNHMIRQGIEGVEFSVCNTDAQALDISPVRIENRIHLGPSITEGRGAGSKPEIGKLAAEESQEVIKAYLEGAKMVFVTAGMGGGTGTGAAPVIARIAKELGILTIGIVTLPFSVEGKKKTANGNIGLDELKQYVDSLVVISNDKLMSHHSDLTMSESFAVADGILTTAAKGIAEIITIPGYVNVDFEDVNTTMKDSGIAVMGTAYMEGEGRALRAAEAALNCPLLEESNIYGAKHVLINICHGTNQGTMKEFGEITDFIQEQAGYDCNIIWGDTHDPKLGVGLAVTVIATGFNNYRPEVPQQRSATVPSSQRPKGADDFVIVRANENSGFDLRDMYTDVDPEPYNLKAGNYHSSRIEKSDNSAQNSHLDFLREEAQERRRLMMQEDLQSNQSNDFSEIENKPAYLRRGLSINHSSFSGNKKDDSSLATNEHGDLFSRPNAHTNKKRPD